MDNNAEFASDLLLFLSGREIKAFSKELACAICAVRIKISVKFAHLIFSSDFPWTFEIRDVEKMELTS